MGYEEASVRVHNQASAQYGPTKNGRGVLATEQRLEMGGFGRPSATEYLGAHRGNSSLLELGD